MRFIALIIVFFVSSNLFSFEIPYSKEEIINDMNLFSEFYRTDINDGSLTPDNTKVWIWRDSKFLHLHWEAKAKNLVKGEFTQEDKLPDADFLRIQIITTPSDPFSYGFYAFPLGNKYDNTRDENLNTDSDWDSNYHYTSQVTDSLWIVDMQIPFRDLRFSGAAPYNWNIILTRYYESDESVYCFPNLADITGKEYFRKAYPITIKQKIFRDKLISVKPYIIANYDLIDDNFENITDDNIGVDFSMKPVSNSKIKVSINPDFSDVPLDNAIDTSNLKYAPTFSENRYFFVEDYNAFGVGTGLFYSRNILQPQYGFKGTYKSDKLSIAVLLTQDKKTFSYEENNDGTISKELENNDDLYHLGSVRYQTDKFNLQSTFLNRESDDWKNKVYHFRPSWEIIENYTLYADLNYSSYKVDSDRNYTDTGYYGKLGFDFSRKNFEFTSYINKMSEDFMAEMGNINEKDSYSYLVEMNQYLPLNKELVKSFNFNMFSESKWKNDSDIMYRNFRIQNQINFQNKLSIDLNGLLEQEKHEGILHDVNYIETSINYRKYRAFAPTYQIRYAHTIRYNHNKVYPYLFQRFGFYSRLTSHIIFSGYIDFSEYLDFKENQVSVTEYYDENEELIKKYEISSWENSTPITSNLDLSLNLNNNITFKVGYRFTDAFYKYQTVELLENNVCAEGETSSNEGIYANLTLQLKNHLNVYFGYNSSKSAPTEYISENDDDYDKLYLKLSYTY